MSDFPFFFFFVVSSGDYESLNSTAPSNVGIRTNFNHERLTIAIGTTRQALVALSSAFAYCLKREAFGKTLMEQPVVRHRLAKAGSLLESQWAWIEQFVYQMCNMKKEEADIELGGLTAAAKANAGVVLKECADCAVLLFGGNGMSFPPVAFRLEMKSANVCQGIPDPAKVK